MPDRGHVLADQVALAEGRVRFLEGPALLGTVVLEDIFPTNFIVVKPDARPEWQPPERPRPDVRIISELELALGDYRPGRFAWKLTNATEISPPVPFSGHPHLYEIPDELLARCV